MDGRKPHRKVSGSTLGDGVVETLNLDAPRLYSVTETEGRTKGEENVSMNIESVGRKSPITR